MSNYEFWDELGRIFNAVVAYQEKSIEFNKRFINPWIRLGNVFDKQDRHREAVSAYQKAVEIDPGNAQNWCDLGNAYFRTQATDQAIHAFKQAIELDPQFGWPYSNLALIYGTQGDYEQATLLYKTSIDLLQENKDKAVSWNRLGNLYRKLNEYDLAVQAFQKADELDHENAGFRDELDEAPALPASADASEGAGQSLEGISSPIQLIVEESQAEEAALRVAIGEPEASQSVDEDLAAEGGEDLPETAVETPAELADAVQAGLLDPVQSQEQMGRLPEELTLEAEAPVVGDDETVQVVEVQVAEQLAAEPVAEAVTEAAEPVAAGEPEPAEIVQDAVETFTESLIVTSTTTDTSEMPVAAQESETPAALEADAVAVAEELAVADLELEAPVAEVVAVADPEPEAPVAEVVAVADPEPEAPAETVEPATASMEVVAEAISEPVAAVEPEMEAVTLPVETPEPAPAAAPELVETTEAAPEVATGITEIAEVVAEPVAQVEGPEPVLEMASVAAGDEIVQAPASEEPAKVDAPAEAAAGTESATPELQVPVEETLSADPVAVEAVEAEPAAEKLEDETEILQHAAYEEFLKNDGKVLNTMTVTPAEDTLPAPASPLPAEPVTRVDETGEFQIAMDTRNAHVWNELGNVYFNNGAIDDSIIAYSKAIELDRWFAWPYSNLALAYVQKDRFAEAVLLYQRSIELFQSEKDKAVSWNRLGNVYRRMNDYDGAIAAYQRADELDPDNTTLSLQSRFSLLGNYQMEQNASLLA